MKASESSGPSPFEAFSHFRAVDAENIKRPLEIYILMYTLIGVSQAPERLFFSCSPHPCQLVVKNIPGSRIFHAVIELLFCKDILFSSG